MSCINLWLGAQRSITEKIFALGRDAANAAFATRALNSDFMARVCSDFDNPQLHQSSDRGTDINIRKE